MPQSIEYHITHPRTVICSVALFQGEINSKPVKLEGAGEIYKVLRNRPTKHKLLFLNFILAKIDKIIQEFQSEYLILDTLYLTLTGEYRCILGLYIEERVISTEMLGSINPLDVSTYKSLENMNVSGRCEYILLKEPLPDEVKKRFLSDCRKFLVELCQQM